MTYVNISHDCTAFMLKFKIVFYKDSYNTIEMIYSLNYIIIKQQTDCSYPLTSYLLSSYHKAYAMYTNDNSKMR